MRSTTWFASRRTAMGCLAGLALALPGASAVASSSWDGGRGTTRA